MKVTGDWRTVRIKSGEGLDDAESVVLFSIAVVPMLLGLAFFFGGVAIAVWYWFAG